MVCYMDMFLHVVWLSVRMMTEDRSVFLTRNPYFPTDVQLSKSRTFASCLLQAAADGSVSIWRCLAELTLISWRLHA